MTRPATALAPQLYPSCACRCLCRVNHPESGAVCEGLGGPPWFVPMTATDVDGVTMCGPCAAATRADGGS